MSILDKLKGKKSEEQVDDGGYKFSLSTGLQKRSASEKDEDQYLAEQESKELSERRILRNRATKQGLKDVGKAAAGAAFSGLTAIGEGAVATGRYVGSTQIAKYAGTRAKGAIEYIPEKFEKARLDYEAGKISQKAYEEAYRQHKIDQAGTRGKASEQRAYRKTQKKDIESLEKRQIEFEAQKAYRKERARAMGRREVAQLDAIRKGQQIEPIQVQPQRPRRHWLSPVYPKNPPRQPTASELDPLGIFSLSGMTQQQTTQNDKFDPTHLHKMLGFNSQARQVQTQQQQVQLQQKPRQAPIKADTSNFVISFLSLNAPRQAQVQPLKTNGKKNGQRKKKLNYFTGQME